MRIYSLSNDSFDFLGIEADGRLLDLSRALDLYETSRGNFVPHSSVEIEELLWSDMFNAAYLGEVYEFCERHSLANDLAVPEGYRVNPPLYPGKIIALGQNYLAHIREMGHDVPDEPVLFGKWPSCIIGHGDPIVLPQQAGRVDYEAELAFVIGRRARNVARAEAMDYVAGYTCLNDVTAREMQARHIEAHLPWMHSKNFDTFAPIGPCVLLAEAVEPPVSIDVRSRVNGEIRQNGNTRDFVFDIPTVIEYISHSMTLDPGDIVTTGTPSGIGPLSPGDTVEVTCGGVGTLVNPVIRG